MCKPYSGEQLLQYACAACREERGMYISGDIDYANLVTSSARPIMVLILTTRWPGIHCCRILNELKVMHAHTIQTTTAPHQGQTDMKKHFLKSAPGELNG